MKHGIYIFPLILLTLFWITPVGRARAQPPITYLDYDVNIGLQEEGSFDVRMIQRLQFDGEFSTAFFELPKDNVTAIEDVHVYELPPDTDLPADPSQFTPVANLSVDERAENVLLEWTYEPTTPGDVRTFVIEYGVQGGLWVYPERDFLSWDAVGADRSGVSVAASTVTVDFPPNVDLNDVEANAAGPDVEIEKSGQQIVFRATESLPDGEFFNVAVSFPHGLFGAQVQSWQKDVDQETLAFSIDRVDVELTVNPDGKLSVAEHVQLSVQNSFLYDGARGLSLLYMDSVNRLQIAQSDLPLQESDTACEGCFTVTTQEKSPSWVYYDEDAAEIVIKEDEAGRKDVAWSFPAMGPGSSTRFDIDYVVDGAIRIGEDNQAITWDVIPDYEQPVASASIRIVLPPGVSPDDVTVDSPAHYDLTAETEGTLLLTYQDEIRPRGRWQLFLTLPADATTAEKPAWQTELEAAIAAQESAAVRQARQTLLTRIAAILAAVLALVGAVVGWLRWGRRRIQEMVGGYLSQPPSDLDAGAVAYLFDRRASNRSVMASLMQLASMGLIEVDLGDKMTIRRMGLDHLQLGERITTPHGHPVEVSSHLAYLFNHVILPTVPIDQAVSFDQFRATLLGAIPQLYAKMASDLHRFFVTSRKPARSLASLMPVLMVTWFLLSAFLMMRVTSRLIDFGPMVTIIGGSFAVLFVLNIMASQFGRRGRSEAGSREAAQWTKFRNYLADLKRYGDLAAAQEIMDRYFAYAVALGVENDLLQQADSLGAAVPTWVRSPLIPAAIDTGTEPLFLEPQSCAQLAEAQAMGNIDDRLDERSRRAQLMTDQERPSLSLLSQQLGSSLTAASTEMGELLSSAAGDAPTQVTIASGTQRRELNWEAGTPPAKVIDDILTQSMTETNATLRARSTRSGSSRSWSGRSSSSRSSGSFGRRSGSSSSRSSSSRRSGGGGRSGFG